jgi:hypothetical protein
MPGDKKKKFKVTEVKLRREASVSDYLKNGKNSDDLKELLKGVGDLKSWTIETKDDRVTAAYPDVAGHPGHVDGSDWKMYIERGKKTTDRLLIKKRKYETEPNKSDENLLNVKIYAALFVEEDTH